MIQSNLSCEKRFPIMSIYKWHPYKLMLNNAYFCGPFDAQVQAWRPGATRSLKKLHISAIFTMHWCPLVVAQSTVVHRDPRLIQALQDLLLKITFLHHGEDDLIPSASRRGKEKRRRKRGDDPFTETGWAPECRTMFIRGLFCVWYYCCWWQEVKESVGDSKMVM